MNGENNFGNNGNQFGFNNNPNDINNNVNNFNQGMQPNQNFNNPNNFNQGMQPNQPINGGANAFIYPNGINVQPNNGGKSNGNKKKKFLIIGGIVVGVIVVLILIISLIGSGSGDTLTCKTTIDSDGVTIESTDVYIFEDGYNSEIEHTYLFSRDGGYSNEDVQAMKDEIGDEEITMFGWDPKITKSGNKLKITSHSPRMGTEDYDTVKKDAEDAGYKCK